ncbi:MAG: flagellar biosynthesis protein FlhG [Planctomycetota bacterium]|jgi:flagellar biosynthesis protein FlhG
MSWITARRKFLELTTGRRPSTSRGAVPVDPVFGESTDSGPRQSEPSLSPQPGIKYPARSVCVASGKGGTGKSVVTACLAHLFSKHGRALVVDADFGVGNAHILQDVTPKQSFVDVVEGGVPLRDVIVRCSPQIDLVAGGSGVPRMAELSTRQLRMIAAGIEDLESDYGYVVVDSAAGLSRQSLAFARSCDEVLLVTTPDLTAMTDAYAFLKVLTDRSPGCEPMLVVNRARSDAEAREVAARIVRVSKRFLGRAPRPIGWIPDDPMVQACVNRRGAVAALEPDCPASLSLAQLAHRIEVELARKLANGLGRSLTSELS